MSPAMSARRAKTTASGHVQCQSTGRAWHLHPVEATPGSHQRGLTHAPLPITMSVSLGHPNSRYRPEHPPDTRPRRYPAVIRIRPARWRKPSTGRLPPVIPSSPDLRTPPSARKFRNPSSSEKNASEMIMERTANPAGMRPRRSSTLRDRCWTRSVDQYPPNSRSNWTKRPTCVLMVGSWTRWVSSIKRHEWHETLTVDGSASGA
jgi:hypothetical protein